MTEETLVYVPLGGAGEIGMNMYLYGYGIPQKRKWIMVDCGVTFGDMKTTPGIELIMPNPDFIRKQIKNLEGICITHAHEDHVGALGYLFEQLGSVPIYTTKFTASIINRKLAEQYVDDADVVICKPKIPVRIGKFEVSFQPVVHSVPDAQGLLIKTPLGNIVHTADFTIDAGASDPYAIWKEIGQEKTLCLACDSTNIFESQQDRTEADIRDNIGYIMQNHKGRIAATTFASNVARLRLLAKEASKHGRSIVVGGRSMHRMISTAMETGVINDFPATISDTEAANLPPENVFYLVTGSQGEGRAALARIASGRHPGIKLQKGDMVIFSSKTIPGNEVEVTDIYNKLIENGVQIIEDTPATPVHISGHAGNKEITQVHQIIKPEICIPMHGEYRHLEKHKTVALENGIPYAHVVPNGRMIQLAPGKPKEIDWVNTGRVYLDGNVLIDSQSGVVKDRLRLATDGIVFVSLVVDEGGELLSDPDVHLSGIPHAHQDWNEPLVEVFTQEIDEAFERLTQKSRTSDDALVKLVKQTVRRVSNSVWGKKTNVTVSLTRLEDEFEE